MTSVFSCTDGNVFAIFYNTKNFKTIEYALILDSIVALTCPIAFHDINDTPFTVVAVSGYWIT